jgi:5,6-dimethylbenzimidazole synthase
MSFGLDVDGCSDSQISVDSISLRPWPNFRSFGRMSWRRGRDVGAGYRRGWNLQFGRLREELGDDSAFTRTREFCRALNTEILISDVRLMNLFLIIRDQFSSISSKNIIEFGCYKGGTAIFLAAALKELGKEGRVFALDTFSGIPTSDSSVDMHRVGDFSDADCHDLRSKIFKSGLDNIEVFEGDFKNSVPLIQQEGFQFGMAHIDCDTQDAVSYAWMSAMSLVVPKGFLIFDDVNTSSCLGATEAMEDMIAQTGMRSEQAWPHVVFRRPDETLEGAMHDDIFRIIGRRKQCRDFDSMPVDTHIVGKLRAVVEAAGSVGNVRPWRIISIESENAKKILENAHIEALDQTIAEIPEIRRGEFRALNVERFLAAPIQWSVFTEVETMMDHRYGWATMPSALDQSTVVMLTQLWMAAEALGLGFAWVTIIEESILRNLAHVEKSWKFTAHIAIGYKFPYEKTEIKRIQALICPEKQRFFES